MNTAPQIPALLLWRDLQATLTDSFTARARGLLFNTFVLRKDGSEVGRLVFDGLRGAEFTAGKLKSTVERKHNGEYEMFAGQDRMLTAYSPASTLNALEIACGDGVYQAGISFLRNEARAYLVDGGEVALLKGDMIGRRYEVAVDQVDPAALPIAVLLLYHTAAFRRRAYVT